MSLEYPHAEDGLRHAGFHRAKEQIKVLGAPELKLPSKLHDTIVMDGGNPVDTAVYVARIGIMADRGVLVQPLGSEELAVTVADMDSYPVGMRLNPTTNKFEPDTKHALNIANEAAKFIASTSQMFSDEATEAGINKWFLHALRIWQLFSEPGQVHFRVDKSTTQPFTPGGLEEAWKTLGFPQPQINTFGRGPFAIRTLHFNQPLKPIDLLPAHD